MKISSKILIGLAIFLVGSLFASNMILKQTYNNPKKRDRFSDAKTILAQPFKHIKIVNGKNCGFIVIDSSGKSEVKVARAWKDFELDSTEKYVKNDTLFLKFGDKDKAYRYSFRTDGLIYILMPEVLSIESDYSRLSLMKFKQKSLTIKLSNNSELDIDSQFSDLDYLKLSLEDSSQLSFENMEEQAPNHIIQVQAAEINLRDSSKLQMQFINPKSLKLISTPNNDVRLSGSTLQGLLKQ
jgi:hypothetical protein